MDYKGIIAKPEWQEKRCPYCYKKLGLLERLARNVKRIFKCRKCGQTIDERFIVW